MTVKIQPQIKPDGSGSSLKVEGDFQIIDMNGNEIPHQGTTAFLCRCGASAKKPFCDSSHKRINFRPE